MALFVLCATWTVFDLPAEGAVTQVPCHEDRRDAVDTLTPGVSIVRRSNSGGGVP